MFVWPCSDSGASLWKYWGHSMLRRGTPAVPFCNVDSREWGPLPAYQGRVCTCSETLGLRVTKQWIRPWWIIVCHPQLLPTHLSLIISFCWGCLCCSEELKKQHLFHVLHQHSFKLVGSMWWSYTEAQKHVMRQQMPTMHSFCFLTLLLRLCMYRQYVYLSFLCISNISQPIAISRTLAALDMISLVNCYK